MIFLFARCGAVAPTAFVRFFLMCFFFPTMPQRRSTILDLTFILVSFFYPPLVYNNHYTTIL